MKQLMILFILGAFAAQSCHKDHNDDLLPTPALKKLSTVQYQYPGQSQTTETFTYDAQGRVTKYDGGEDVSTVVFTGNKVEVTETRTAENNRIVFHFIGTLDAAGRVTGGSGAGNYNINLLDQRSYSLEYNANGSLKKAKLIINSTNTYEVYYTWANGNLVKIDNFTNGVKESTMLFEYNTAIENRLAYSAYSGLAGQLPTGQISKNMWSKYTLKRDGAADFTSTVTYTQDADGYIETQHVVSSNGKDDVYYYHFK